MQKLVYILCFMSGVLVLSSILYKESQPSNDDLINNGKHWFTACTLKEVNIPTGILTSNVNRLDCSGVVVNVETDKYDRAVSAYNEFENKGNIKR